MFHVKHFIIDCTNRIVCIIIGVKLFGMRIDVSMKFVAGEFDVAVIGAGHAGIEAGLASARLGCKTAVFTINMDAVGNCPCNPSIGGTAKGHLVREIDALGGEMGKAADECFLQIRMLNKGKGPAVHSLRAQIDRRAYSTRMKHTLELQKNLELRQAEITNLERNDDGRWILTTRLEAQYIAKAVILATGTYLGGKIYVGDVSYESGPDGMFPSKYLPDALEKLGMSIRRFKTGTPARVLKSSIDFTDLEEQCGDEPVVPFSYDTDEPKENKVKCYVSWTNDKTKKIILDNIHRSPMYSGKIEGIGPRYCPSIEDKIVRFSDKQRHQLFIEPCGMDTEEMYLQGMSSSLPEDVQISFYHSIKGLENCVVMRPAYAIEYYCADPVQMNGTLEFRDFPGLYGAGQFNGSSGYEEAAAQGITYSTEIATSGARVNVGTFTKDTVEYRRQKFYSEFDKHLDKHYCAVYFVMTELLLCYDSRGKNMMIASFGPHEVGGDYIWYPIFYDIDTQLGLNNVGAKLWDYDEDCTENGTFSTAQSVLWENFFDLFKEQITTTYRRLRSGTDESILARKNIEGAYNCDPKVFKSYAMEGRRPIIAMGLDIYYKYVLPTIEEWRNQAGTMTTANYLYACQGDRKLSRELLINNRLLYMDSKWLSG